MKTKPQTETFIIIILLSIILIVCFYDVVFLGKTFKLTTGNSQTLITGPYGQENNRPESFPVHSTDVPVFEEPVMQFIKNSFRQGIYPLWNPHQACGIPLVGMMHTGILFPLNAILYILPNTISWDILIFFRLLLSGLLTFWFMRVLRFHPVPALGAAIALMLSGSMLFFHWSFVQVDLLTPLLLVAMEYFLRKSCLRNAACVALAVSLTLFAGHPEHIFLINSYCLAFFTFRFFSTRNWRDSITAFPLLGLAYLLAAGLAAIILFPFLQNWHSEFWHAHSNFIGTVPEGSNIWTETLINFVVPQFFQKEIVTLDFVRSTFWGHLGIFTLGLAFIGLFRNQRRGLNFYMGAMAFLIFAKSYIDFPLINWIGGLPFFRLCRFVHHTHYLFAFTIAILAGMGIRHVLSRKPTILLGILFACILTGFIGFNLFQYRHAEHFPLSVRSSLLGGIFLLAYLFILAARYRNLLNRKTLSFLLVGMMALELFCYVPRKGRVKRFDSFPQVPYINFIKNLEGKNQLNRIRSYGTFWTFHPNTASGYTMDDFGIVENLLPKRYVRFINEFIFPGYFDKEKTTTAFWIIPVTFLPNAQPYFNLLNVHFTIAPLHLIQFFPPAAQPGFHEPFYAKEVLMFDHAKAFPRTFIVHKAIFEPDEQTMLNKIKKIQNALNIFTVIHHEPVKEILSQLRQAPLQTISQTKITRYSPNEVIIKADMKHPGFLILSDSYHPDWKAYVDGTPTKIYLADSLLRAVFLKQGEHTVVFRFQPVSFIIGAVISALTLLIVAGIITVEYRARRSHLLSHRPENTSPHSRE